MQKQQPNPKFIYIYKGRENLIELKSIDCGRLESFDHNFCRNKGIQLLFCTKDYKQIFAKNKNDELIQISNKTKKTVCNYGLIYHNFGDLVILGCKLTNNHKQNFMRFKTIDSFTPSDAPMVNEELQLKPKMFDHQIFLGQYRAADQGWGNKKGSMQFHLNGMRLYSHAPIGRPIKKFEFQLDMEKAFAKPGDVLCNKYSVGGGGGHRIYVDDIDIFTQPKLYVPLKKRYGFEYGIVVEKHLHDIPNGYALSEYTMPYKTPQVDQFVSADLSDINCQYQKQRIVEIQSKANLLAVDIPYCSFEIGATPWQWEVNETEAQQFMFVDNKNGTFCIETQNYDDLVLGVVKSSGPQCSVSLVKKVFGKKEQQWYLEKNCIVNVAGGYLTASSDSTGCGTSMYCSLKSGKIHQNWNLNYKNNQ